MNQSDVEEFVEQLDNVERTENFGYILFFVGDDRLLPFVTIAQSDKEYDKVSNLDREGVFRINIGVKRETFMSMFEGKDSESFDYSVLNTFLPHPDYSRQSFICILNPSDENVEITKGLIREAHSIATARLQRKASR